MGKASDAGAVALIAFPIILWLAAIGGWVANIVKIFGTADDPITAFFIIRCIGVFAAPLGAVLGFL